MGESRSDRLAAALAAIRRRWGAGALGFAPTRRPPLGAATLATGFAALDAALGGGIGFGQAVALWGPPTCGATTLLLHTLARAQAEGLNAAFLDLPRSFDPAAAQHCGVDLAGLILAHPDGPREALAIAQALLTSRTAEIVAIGDIAPLLATPDGTARLRAALTLLRPTLRRTGGVLLLRCPSEPGQKAAGRRQHAGQGSPLPDTHRHRSDPDGDTSLIDADLILGLRRTGWLWERDQVDKQALEDAGLIKIDLLGLRTLSMLAEAERLLAGGGSLMMGHQGDHADRSRPEDAVGVAGGGAQAQGRTATRSPLTLLASLTPDDPAVYAMLSAGDSIGVFQVESRAQAQLLPRLRPACFADLIVAISLIRPGPIQGEMVHPYLRRRAGIEPVTFAHPALAPALGETLGVILFQEQVLKVARALVGFSPGQGEQLRRALGRMPHAESRRPMAGHAGSRHDAEPDRQASHEDAAFARIHADFIAGAVGRGVPAEVAEAVFGQLRAFAGYAFPKSHAAAFAVLVYQAAWLKRYHPAAFYAAPGPSGPSWIWPTSAGARDCRNA